METSLVEQMQEGNTAERTGKETIFDDICAL